MKIIIAFIIQIGLVCCIVGQTSESDTLDIYPKSISLSVCNPNFNTAPQQLPQRSDRFSLTLKIKLPEGWGQKIKKSRVIELFTATVDDSLIVNNSVLIFPQPEAKVSLMAEPHPTQKNKNEVKINIQSITLSACDCSKVDFIHKGREIIIPKNQDTFIFEAISSTEYKIFTAIKASTDTSTRGNYNIISLNLQNNLEQDMVSEGGKIDLIVTTDVKDETNHTIIPKGTNAMGKIIKLEKGAGRNPLRVIFELESIDYPVTINLDKESEIWIAPENQLYIEKGRTVKFKFQKAN
jgi:hypothetical protein